MSDWRDPLKQIVGREEYAERRSRTCEGCRHRRPGGTEPCLMHMHPEAHGDCELWEEQESE